MRDYIRITEKNKRDILPWLIFALVIFLSLVGFVYFRALSKVEYARKPEIQITCEPIQVSGNEATMHCYFDNTGDWFGGKCIEVHFLDANENEMSMKRFCGKALPKQKEGHLFSIPQDIVKVLLPNFYYYIVVDQSE